jgi:hypothetical protein
MKKFVFFFLVGLTLNASAQTLDSVYEIRSDIGLMLCSQAFISANHPSELFTDGTNLFLIGSINYRNSTLFPYLKMYGDNAIGFFFQQSLCKEKAISGYVYFDKNINIPGNDYGVGINKEIGDYISVFIEYNEFLNCEQFFTMGICITGMIRDLPKKE